MADMEMWRSDNLTVREKEITAVLHWFRGWSVMQKEEFLRDLLDKALPPSVDGLGEALDSLALGNSSRAPSIFKCQLKLFTGWFFEWTRTDRDNFMRKLTEIDAAYVRRFYELLEARSTQTATR